MKLLSIGTIITDGTNILLGHISGTNKFDIPKGLQELGETYLDTAKRELKEEFGLVFDDLSFQRLGLFFYTKSKDLFLYKIILNNLYFDIKLNELNCISTFKLKDIELKEMDSYKIVQIDRIKIYCYKGMVKILNMIF